MVNSLIEGMVEAYREYDLNLELMQLYEASYDQQNFSWEDPIQERDLIYLESEWEKAQNHTLWTLHNCLQNT